MNWGDDLARLRRRGAWCCARRDTCGKHMYDGQALAIEEIANRSEKLAQLVVVDPVAGVGDAYLLRFGE